MATKSFLTSEQTKQAQELVSHLWRPSRLPDGDERKNLGAGAHEFSHWLGERLFARLNAHPDWALAGPVILGSWARGELCPKSDIDVLFCGSEESVLRLVGDFSKDGVKLRYRMPEDPANWTKGVEPFDVLALLSARGMTPDSTEKLKAQIELIRNQGRQFRQRLLRAMRGERKARADRYDSISNFLEPNLKYGPGGLRDLEQALVARELFSERFTGDDHAFAVLLYYKVFFLSVRQKLHLADGAADVLAAPEQRAISDWLGYKDVKDFMREIQKGLARVSFYADWAIEQAGSPIRRIEKVHARKLDSVTTLFKAIEADPSILMQNQIRSVSDRIFQRLENARRFEKQRADNIIGKALTRILDPGTPEAAMIALFRSRLVDQFNRIKTHTNTPGRKRGFAQRVFKQSKDLRPRSRSFNFKPVINSQSGIGVNRCMPDTQTVICKPPYITKKQPWSILPRMKSDPRLPSTNRNKASWQIHFWLLSSLGNYSCQICDQNFWRNRADQKRVKFLNPTFPIRNPRSA